LDTAHAAPPLAMLGLEPDNLLALLTLLGLLRSLEASRPHWRPRASWKGPPWIEQLILEIPFQQAEVARAANEGINDLLKRFDVDTRKNVNFEADDYRLYAKRLRNDVVAAALASALAAECPPKRDGRLSASPLVMMFGQGHQNFLERLIDVPRGQLPNRLRKHKSPPDMTDPGKVEEALFLPWRREDDADGFRWDPEDDQRYALRYGKPSLAGAAPTVVGANRLAAVGFLSFSTTPGERQMGTVGAMRENGEWFFVWPIWLQPLSRSCIEALLNHPALLDGDLRTLRPLGVAEIYRARRIANGKFLSVARGRPVGA
jgi:hypothetical protein